MKRLLMSMFFVGLLIAVVVAPTGRFEAAKQYALAYKMDEGTSFTLNVAIKHRNQRNIMGNNMTTNSEDLLAYRFTVKSSDKNGMLVELEYTKRVHESDDPQIQAGPDFSELIGKKVEMHLSPIGVMSAFEGFDDLPEITIPSEGDRLVESRYVNEVKYLFPRLSATPVSPGDSWSYNEQHEEQVGEEMMPVVIHYTYTLVEETRIDNFDCVKIEGEYSVKISDRITAGGIELDLNLAGTGEETAYFARKKGMLLRSESNSVLTGSADNEEMGMSIQMDHEFKTLTKINLD